MGSKGSAQTTTNQTQTYAPAGAGYITNALNQAQNAASLPFNIPQAPVAGFSADQLAAFQNVNKAQGMAQPYINTAAGYFSPQGAQQFLNPYAQNVMANMKDVFGQQQAQTTGQLTQAAGGIGADRIAVGQAELAKQQGLAAGQTMSGLYQNAVQQAQGAGYGTAALGSQAQNAALQGAQAQLGTGGLQQQLAQAQLNAPYQQQLAQAAFPYQQAQFLAGITGSLAPGLGGTTTGQGTTTQPAPSLLSQILGAGTAGAGILGGTGAFGNNGWLTGGNKGTSAGSYGGGGTNYGQAYNIGYGGRSMPVFGRGGVISDANDIDLPNEPDGAGYDDGGSVSNAPIDVAPKSIIPTGQIPAIQAHVPQLNLNPPQQQQQQSGGGGGFGDLLKTGLSIAAMVARGGAIRNPYAFADGGSPSDTDFASLTRGDPAWANPDVGGGYALPPAPKAGFENRWGNFPAAQTDPQFLQQYQNAMGPRIGYDPRIEKAIADNTVPTPQARPAAADATTAVAADELPASAEPTAGVVGATSPNPYARPATTPPDTTGAAAKRDTGFIGSPWAALTAAGLGMMAGTSPYAGVNIGQGAMQGLKTLEAQREQARKDETTDQAAKRLEQEAKQHEDQYNRMTPYQREQVNMAERKQALEEMKPVQVGLDLLNHPIYARKDPKTGQYINVLTGKPVENPMPEVPEKYNIPGSPDASIPPHAQLTAGVDIPAGTNPDVLARLPPQLAAKVRAVDEGRMSLTSIPVKDRGAVQDYLTQYDPEFDQGLWTLRSAQQRDLSTNGNAGKMILAVNQLLPHLKTASDAAIDLHNKGYPAANVISNWWATATGDPRVKKFDEVREVAAMDAARLLRGSGAMAEKDIEFWRNNLSSSNSPQQLQAQIGMLADDLMDARIKSIEQSYRMNMRKEPPDFVSKDAKAALDAIKTRKAAFERGPAPGAAPGAAAAAPAQAAETPPVPGARKAPDGNWYVQQGGKYHRVVE